MTKSDSVALVVKKERNRKSLKSNVKKSEKHSVETVSTKYLKESTSNETSLSIDDLQVQNINSIDRKVYTCRVCAVPAKGHICPYRNPDGSKTTPSIVPSLQSKPTQSNNAVDETEGNSEITLASRKNRNLLKTKKGKSGQIVTQLSKDGKNKNESTTICNEVNPQNKKNFQPAKKEKKSNSSIGGITTRPFVNINDLQKMSSPTNLTNRISTYQSGTGDKKLHSPSPTSNRKLLSPSSNSNKKFHSPSPSNSHNKPASAKNGVSNMVFVPENEEGVKPSKTKLKKQKSPQNPVTLSGLSNILTNLSALVRSASIDTQTDPIQSSDPARRIYKCRHCGLALKGHICSKVMQDIKHSPQLLKRKAQNEDMIGFLKKVVIPQDNQNQASKVLILDKKGSTHASATRVLNINSDMAKNGKSMSKTEKSKNEGITLMKKKGNANGKGERMFKSDQIPKRRKTKDRTAVTSVLVDPSAIPKDSSFEHEPDDDDIHIDSSTTPPDNRHGLLDVLAAVAALDDSMHIEDKTGSQQASEHRIQLRTVHAQPLEEKHVTKRADSDDFIRTASSIQKHPERNGKGQIDSLVDYFTKINKNRSFEEEGRDDEHDTTSIGFKRQRYTEIIAPLHIFQDEIHECLMNNKITSSDNDVQHPIKNLKSTKEEDSNSAQYSLKQCEREFLKNCAVNCENAIFEENDKLLAHSKVQKQRQKMLKETRIERNKLLLYQSKLRRVQNEQQRYEQEIITTQQQQTTLLSALNFLEMIQHFNKDIIAKNSEANTDKILE